MSKFLLYSSSFMLMAIIVWLGVESLEIKLALGIISLTFIPGISNKLYKAPLVIRKGKVAFYTPFLFALLFFIFSLMTETTLHNEDYTILILVFPTCLLGSVLYGIPVSLISDLLTANAQEFRIPLSLLLHIGFAIASLFFLNDLMILAVFISILFFLIDEFLRRKERKRNITLI